MKVKSKTWKGDAPHLSHGISGKFDRSNGDYFGVFGYLREIYGLSGQK